jgi:hypothetical protein
MVMWNSRGKLFVQKKRGKLLLNLKNVKSKGQSVFCKEQTTQTKKSEKITETFLSKYCLSSIQSIFLSFRRNSGLRQSTLKQQLDDSNSVHLPQAVPGQLI